MVKFQIEIQAPDETMAGKLAAKFKSYLKTGCGFSNANFYHVKGRIYEMELPDTAEAIEKVRDLVEKSSYLSLMENSATGSKD